MLDIEKVEQAVEGKIKIEYFEEVTSTNELLQKRARHEMLDEFHTMVAGAQSEGVGRYGRKFHSPKDTGIYLSVLLKPDSVEAKTTQYITIAASVAVCKALEKISGKRCEIKWVNDIYIEGKKVAGILAQGQVDNSSGLINQIILGIGVNIYEPIEAFPEEISSKAGYVLEGNQKCEGVKETYVACLLNAFMEFYKTLDKKTYVGEYISRSMLVGKEVEVIQKEDRKTAQVLEVNSDCNLVVEYEDSTKEVLLCGEVSLNI